MNKIILILLILIFINVVSAETIIYDNITTSNYKTIQIDDVSNMKYISEYNYRFFLNDSYLGEYSKNDLIFYPDSVNVIVYIPSNVKEKLDSNVVSSGIGVFFYSFLQYGIYIILILIAIAYFLLSKRRR